MLVCTTQCHMGW